MVVEVTMVEAKAAAKAEAVTAAAEKAEGMAAAETERDAGTCR